MYLSSFRKQVIALGTAWCCCDSPHSLSTSELWSSLQWYHSQAGPLNMAAPGKSRHTSSLQDWVATLLDQLLVVCQSLNRHQWKCWLVQSGICTLERRVSKCKVRSTDFTHYMDCKTGGMGFQRTNVLKGRKMNSKQNEQQITAEDWNVPALSSNGGSLWCHTVL